MIKLTNRQQTVASYLTQGMTNKQIAKELNIAAGTVKLHVRVLLQKYNTKSRVVVAVRYALSQKKDQS